MKDRLKVLFSFFNVLKTKKVKLLYHMDNLIIEEAAGLAFIDSLGSEIQLPNFIETILEELITNNVDKIFNYISTEYDDWWKLTITIYPREEKLIFGGLYKDRVGREIKKDYNTNDINLEPINTKIDKLYSLFDYDVSKFEFGIYGRYGDSGTYNFEVDNKTINITDEIDDLIWYIGYDLFKKVTGDRYWNEDSGCDGYVVLWGDHIFVQLNQYFEEYIDCGEHIVIK